MIKLVISPETPPCVGCIYYNGDCTRPEDHDSCLVPSPYGLHAGIFIEDNNKETT